MVRWVREHRNTIWLVGFTILVMYALWQNQQQARDGQQARDAICSLKQDLRDRIHSGERFLHQHPNGLPQLGLSPIDIQRTIDGQNRTLNSLRIPCRS